LAEQEIADLREKNLPEEQRGKNDNEYLKNTREMEWAAKEEQAREDYHDYDTVVNKTPIKVPVNINDAIISSNMGADLVYYLSQNPKEIGSLHGLGPADLHRAIGRLEVRVELSKKVKNEAEKPVAKQSKAPEPIKPVAQRGTAPEKDILDPKTPIDEFMKRRNAERFKKGLI
jgi:hypothetical protein